MYVCMCFVCVRVFLLFMCACLCVYVIASSFCDYRLCVFANCINCCKTLWSLSWSHSIHLFLAHLVLSFLLTKFLSFFHSSLVIKIDSTTHAHIHITHLLWVDGLNDDLLMNLVYLHHCHSSALAFSFSHWWRFHDNTPINFNNVDHSFTLELECLE